MINMETIRNHDHLDFEQIRRSESVRALSQFTPSQEHGDFEPIENMLSRIDEVADGMAKVVRQIF
jgi:hypothetical protein